MLGRDNHNFYLIIVIKVTKCKRSDSGNSDIGKGNCKVFPLDENMKSWMFWIKKMKTSPILRGYLIRKVIK